MCEFETMSVHNKWDQETLRLYAEMCQVKESMVRELSDCASENVMLVMFYGRREEKRTVVVHVHHRRSSAYILREVGRIIGRKGWMVSVFLVLVLD